MRRQGPKTDQLVGRGVIFADRPGCGLRRLLASILLTGLLAPSPTTVQRAMRARYWEGAWLVRW